MMGRKRILVLLLALVLSFGVLRAYAGLSFIGSGTVGFGSVKGTVKIAGFGRDTVDVFVRMDVQGRDLMAWCKNRGGNIAPGQNPVSVMANVTSTDVQPAHNGTAIVEMSVNILPTAVEAGCPNRNWTVTDLLGVFYLQFTGIDRSTDPDTVVTQFQRCDVNERQKWISCVEISASQLPPWWVPVTIQ